MDILWPREKYKLENNDHLYPHSHNFSVIDIYIFGTNLWIVLYGGSCLCFC